MNMTKKLYELPRGSKLYGYVSDGSKFVTFGHIDGAYSFNTTEKGNIVHIRAWTEFKPFEDGWTMVDESACASP